MGGPRPRGKPPQDDQKGLSTDMEIMNCEQYVLGELEEAHATIAKLMQENDRLQAQIEILEGQLDAKDPRGDEVRSFGRKIIAQKGAYTTTPAEQDGEVKSFEEWVIDAVTKYTIPDGWKRREFIDYFEPELRGFYDERVKELDEDEEEDE